MLRRIISQVPNTITCLSLFFGAIAIIASFHFNDTVWGLPCYQWAFICIGISAVCDFLDGASARMLHAYSNLGKQLDSLSDLVSFGVAPGMLVYNMMTLQAGPAWLPFVAIFIPLMGELRLARFNIDDRQTTSFLGMPIPANAIFWIGSVSWMTTHGYIGHWPMAVLVVAMSLLMVATRIHMFSLKFKNFDFRENLRRYVIILAALLFVISESVPGLAWTILFYLVLSLLPSRA